jgi:Flp pilus assembly protein TadD
MLRAELAQAGGRLEEAGSLLREACARQSPPDEDALAALCEFLFAYGSTEEAEPALRELARRRPLDGAAHHNLGTLYVRMGRHADAARAYRESLRHRPDSPATRDLLRQVEAIVGHLAGRDAAN